ncbi:MAG TPA: hypothetical protein DER39_07225, partial [Porphyromonadaceae bacterium]|nr:hypothetical protein [Porphyromonadaceae bacterium]
TIVNGLMCAVNVTTVLENLFGEKVLYVEYTDPGYVLFKKVDEKIKEYRQKFSEEPQVIWLQNHGIFVAADSIEEIKSIYGSIFATLEKAVSIPLPEDERKVCRCVSEVLPAIRMLVSKDNLKTLKVRRNGLIEYFCESPKNQVAIAKPFTPDAIVYCKSNYLFLNDETPGQVLENAEELIPGFVNKFGYLPKVLLIKGIGLVSVGDNARQCDTILDVFEDAMKVAFLSQSFGGAHPMTQAQIEFIDNWEVENYRRSVAAGNASGRVENKTIVVTGAAQGFG